MKKFRIILISICFSLIISGCQTVKDKTDAIEYAKEKKKIKNQGNKELPLVNN